MSDKPMTYADFLVALTVMSEEKVGAPIRAYQRQQSKADSAALSRLDRFKG